LVENTYNTIRYITYPQAQTHPDHLATLATLFGLKPAPARACRVLEVGCGTGTNLIAMAQGLPESEFVGIDLASAPIEEGRRLISALGLRNIDLRAMDLMDAGADLGTFDYIVAVGVFGWVPAFVREKLLALCASQLSPHGVAFISYNCYPGFYLRNIVRDLLLYHTAEIEDPERVLDQSFAIMRDMLELQSEVRDEYDNCLRAELTKTLDRDPGGLYHDELDRETTAFYFRDVVAMARAHNLEYLGETEFFMMQAHLRGDKVEEAMRGLAGDVVRREQYLDFLHGRRYRQTLLCRQEAPLEREPKAESMRALYFSCPARKDKEGKYRRATGVPVKPVHPLAIAALEHLRAFWPRRMSFADLLAACGPEAPAADLCQILMGCFSAGILDAHMDAPHFVLEPGDRPVISPLARLHLADDEITANVCHALVRVADPACRRMAQLLDGSRDRAALARETGISEDEADQFLKQLAGLALLVA
jgi:SAM-dependent methyltransferase